MSDTITLVPREIEDYAIAHSSPQPAIHAGLRARTVAETTLPQMQIGHMEGRFLYLLAKLAGARTAVEIGTFTGTSALHIAEALTDDGTLITCDISEEWTAIARDHWAQVPWGHKIDLRLAPALETLATLDGPIDFAFIDADKGGYIAYWEALVPKMRRGGLIVVDNVLWGGKVLNPQDDSDHAICAFNDHARADTRMELVMLTVRDGVTVARKP